MASSKELRAELTMVELEEEFVKAKDKKSGPSKEMKAELRAARKAFREEREARAPAAGEARPATIKATTKMKSPGVSDLSR